MGNISTRAQLTSAQKEHYKLSGYLSLRSVFSEVETMAWKAECDRLLALELIDPMNIRTPFRKESGNTPERIDPVVDISLLFARMVRDERIVGAVRDLFEDEPLLFKDKLILKAPGTDGYTMHQDQAWWQLCPPNDILSVSIQIDGSSAQNGCIELFGGYHHEMLTPQGLETNFRAEELAEIDLSRGEKIETQHGDVLIFHSLTPHQSGRNTADTSRRSLYLSYNAARSGDLHGRYYAHYKNRESGGQKYFR